PIEIAPEAPGKPAEIKVVVELGVCKDICVPVTFNFELTVPDARALPASVHLAKAVDAVPRRAAGRRDDDPIIERQVAVLDGAKPSLTFHVAYPAGAVGADLFVEAPDGAWVPLPAIKPDKDGRRVTFEIDLSTGVDLKDLIGKPLAVTVVGPTGALETSTVLKAK
ncbi:MAG TPA: hypothetical protein PK264_17580, partial [Hyphomicrobiaceae bacterium]|nr:hypothetical protein [Hyphomicrobiaceae bacterium]